MIAIHITSIQQTFLTAFILRKALSMVRNPFSIDTTKPITEMLLAFVNEFHILREHVCHCQIELEIPLQEIYNRCMPNLIHTEQ